MSVYGLKEYVDNKPATLVVAADSVEEYGKWYADLQALEGDDRLFENEILSEVMWHLTDPTYKGFKKPVHVVFHKDDAQRDAFFDQQKLIEQKSNPARDRQADMLHKQKEDIREATETEEERNRTIEERTGLDVNDPYDRRSEEEIEADRAMKKQMADLRKTGEVSSDSFADPDAIRAQRKADRLKEALAGKMSETMAREQLQEVIDPSDADYAGLETASAADLQKTLEKNHIEGVEVISDEEYEKIRESIMGPAEATVHVSDVKAVRNDDGTFEIDSVTAHKRGGEVDTELQEQREADYEEKRNAALGGRRSFSPDDFEKVLRGDGRGDAVVNVDGDKDNPAGPGHSRPSLSDHAEAARREHQAAEAARRQQAEESAPVRPAPQGKPATRDITLTPKMWDEIDALVAGGDYADASEVIRDAIRAYARR